MHARNILLALLFTTIATTGLIAKPNKKAITKNLSKLTYGSPKSITKISKTPIKNMYEVLYDGQVYYTNRDGSYVLYGSLLDLTQTRPVDLTAKARQVVTKKILAELPTSETVVFKATNGKKPKHILTVFTDIDCGYCRKLHQEVPALNKAGIEVHYAAFPRAGVGSNSYKKISKVWCSKNPQQALTQAKQGQNFDTNKKCNKDKIINHHMELVKKLGISGTPTLFFDNGEKVPGYMPAQRLIQEMNKSSNG